MSFASQGYLSPDLAGWIVKHRSENSVCFGLADRLNRVCQSVMLACSVPDNDQWALVTLLLFARALSSFQGGVLMVERGMTIEALTLARSGLESSFYLAALARNPTLIERMISSDAKHKRQTVRWLTSPAAASAGLPPEQVQQLCDLLKKPVPSAPPLTIQAAAQEAEMSEVYETVYRDLCDRAAHPSLTSLVRHITHNSADKIDSLRFRPDGTDTQGIILALAAVLPVVIGVGKIFPIADESTSELNACWELYRQLMSADGTWARS
jgi:hypothetical protein